MAARIKSWQEKMFIRTNIDVTYQSVWVAKIQSVLMRNGYAWFIENIMSKYFIRLKLQLKTCANFILFIILNSACATIYTLTKQIGTELKYIPFPLSIANKYKKTIKPFLFPMITFKDKNGKMRMKRVLIPLSKLYDNIIDSYKGNNRHIFESKRLIFEQVWLNRTKQHYRWI